MDGNFGVPAPLGGLLGPTCLFDDVLQANHVQALYNAGQCERIVFADTRAIDHVCRDRHSRPAYILLHKAQLHLRVHRLAPLSECLINLCCRSEQTDGVQRGRDSWRLGDQDDFALQRKGMSLEFKRCLATQAAASRSFESAIIRCLLLFGEQLYFANFLARYVKTLASIRWPRRNDTQSASTSGVRACHVC